MPRTKAVFLQRHVPTLTRCGDYDVTAPSTKRSTAASSESFFVPFDHCNLTRVARKLHSCHGGSLCFGESHSAERRHSQSTCCCWLAEHRQRVHQRLQQHKIIAQLLPMKLEGRASFFGHRKADQPGGESSVAPGRRRRIPGLCPGGQRLL